MFTEFGRGARIFSRHIRDLQKRMWRDSVLIRTCNFTSSLSGDSCKVRRCPRPKLQPTHVVDTSILARRTPRRTAPSRCFSSWCVFGIGALVLLIAFAQWFRAESGLFITTHVLLTLFRRLNHVAWNEVGPYTSSFRLRLSTHLVPSCNRRMF